MKKHTRIKDLPESTRPREKLLEKGAENVSDGELVAILLGSGTRKQNALSVAKSILGTDGIPGLLKQGLPDLVTFGGIGKTKAARLLAAVEIGRRAFSAASLTKRKIMTCADAVDQLRDIAAHHQEHLVALYLNARHELISRQTISVGNLNTTYAEPRAILAPALTLPCASVIIAHNHPSDDPTPSSGDIRFTQRITEAGLIIGVELVDHIIICRSGYFSFLENGLMEKQKESI